MENQLVLVLQPGCKNAVYIFPDSADLAVPTDIVPVSGYVPVPLLKVHGNVLYDLNYNSRVDTPFQGSDIYQHTVQCYFDVVYKNNYPFRIYLTNRFSNTSFFQNFLDLNLQFNQQEFAQQVKERIYRNLLAKAAPELLKRLKDSLNTLRDSILALQVQKRNGSLAQKEVEAKEAAYNKRFEQPGLSPDLLTLPRVPARPFKFSLPGKDSALNNRVDSLSGQVMPVVKTGTAVKDSLQQQYVQLSARLRESEKALQLLNGNALRDIQAAANAGQLRKQLKTYGLQDTVLPKGFNTLMNVRSVGIGRCMVDYSMLSAKNVTLTGLQVEYNPGWYAAFAAGTVDYRFRDYTVKSNLPSQYLVLGRLGKGDKDGDHIYFTLYNGKKQIYNSYTSQQPTATNFALVGWTMEFQKKIGDQTLITLEGAKSSVPAYMRVSGAAQQNLKEVTNFSNHSNEAIGLKLQTFITPTHTRLTANYRLAGENFQSYSFFTSGARQAAWSVRADQPLFKRVLTLTGSLRANDFMNPFPGQQITSKTIFKSLQGTLRIRKWPVLSAGYFPSSQIVKLNEVISENLFYTINANANHYYKAGKWMMNTAATYTRFFNRSTDSGFVYFNSTNILFTQNIMAGRVSATTAFLQSVNQEYRIYTLDQHVRLAVSKWLTLGGGIKLNRQTSFHIFQVGYACMAGIKVPVLGEVQFQADKGFLPGLNKRLAPYNVARFTYFKTF